jgi:hypothetical protein
MDKLSKWEKPNPMKLNWEDDLENKINEIIKKINEIVIFINKE